MNTTAAEAVGSSTSQWAHVPIGLFGSVMGLTGLSLVWATMHAQFGTPSWIAQGCAYAAILAFVLITLAYAAKLMHSRARAKAEFGHPIAVNLFATFWISLLLLPMVIAPLNLMVARLMWAVGALGMAVFAVFIVDRWLSSQHQIAHATPAWILPVVGLLDLPLAIPYLSLPQLRGFMLVGLAIGLFFAIPLFTLIFSRLVFEPPMPVALRPTLMILVAPFAVGMSTYVATTGQVDLLAKSLYVLTIFLLLVLLGRLRNLGDCCPFRFAWWAVSFPLAASAIASLRFAEAEPGALTIAIAIGLVAVSTIVILWLLIRTVSGVFRGDIGALSS